MMNSRPDETGFGKPGGAENEPETPPAGGETVRVGEGTGSMAPRAGRNENIMFPARPGLVPARPKKCTGHVLNARFREGSGNLAARRVGQKCLQQVDPRLRVSESE